MELVVYAIIVKAILLWFVFCRYYLSAPQMHINIFARTWRWNPDKMTTFFTPLSKLGNTIWQFSIGNYIIRKYNMNTHKNIIVSNFIVYLYSSRIVLVILLGWPDEHIIISNLSLENKLIIKIKIKISIIIIFIFEIYVLCERCSSLVFEFECSNSIYI